MSAMTEQQSSETYQGWTNRETWVVALHINNDQGWQESVHDALRAYVDSISVRALIDGNLTRDHVAAGEIVRENVEEMLDPNSDLHLGAGGTLKWYAESIWPVVEDIGSLWRVNWTELGRSFLEDLAEQD